MNKIDIFYLTDSTYLDKKNSRRLRSLGGGLRRILLSIKDTEDFITNGEIIENINWVSLTRY